MCTYRDGRTLKRKILAVDGWAELFLDCVAYSRRKSAMIRVEILLAQYSITTA